MLTFTIFDQKQDADITIFVGQSAAENWQLIDNAKQQDLWFHLDKFASPHVVISMPEKGDVSSSTIKYAALLCKEHSKEATKYLKKITVIYTNIKNVTKADKVGSVYTKRIKKIVT